ncbi:NAD(P)-dependent oxidoreductase [Acidothermaceae bacterium B102]|nr:NAD(P)-dependent oxidoreductase [Acidothermaceae bacterium B102]
MPTVVAVTGASGKTGPAVVAHLVSEGYQVRAIDSVGAPGDRGPLAALGAPLVRADLTDYGQALDALDGADAVVHLAAIPAPGFFTDAHTLNTNTVINNNVFLSAAKVGVTRVVWSASETTLGLPFGEAAPRYLPVDEDHHPLPTSAYALSKVLGEVAAEHVSAWSGIPFVGLRLSNVHVAEDYARVPSYSTDVRERVFNLWAYVDVRDVARACRLALTADVTGARNYIIVAQDTLMEQRSAQLAESAFPEVPLRRPLLGHESLLSGERAEVELGFRAEHSWRTAGRPV